MANIDYNLGRMQSLISEKFKGFGIELDKNIIDGDFVKFNVELTIKKYNNASVFYSGTIGNHGYGRFEAVFDELVISEDSLVAINTLNDNSSLMKAYVSRRGNPGKYFFVVSFSTKYCPTEEAMRDMSVVVLDNIIDDDYVSYIKEVLNYLR